MKKISWIILILIIAAAGIIIYRHIFYSVDKEILRVEVLNGTTVNGLAGRAAEYLRDKKLDVIIISNANEDTISKTIVIDRLNPRCVYGNYVADRIDCPNTMVDIDSSLYIDVTVIMGNDWKLYMEE